MSDKKAEFLAKTDLIRENYISKKESIETSSQLNDQAKQKRLLQHKIQHNETLQKLRDEYRAGGVKKKEELEKKLFSLSHSSKDSIQDKQATQMNFRDALARAQAAADLDNADRNSNALEKLLNGAEIADDALLKTAIATVCRDFRFNDLAAQALGEKQAPLYSELLQLEDALENPTSAEMFDEASIFAPVEYVSALDLSQDVEAIEPEPRSTITGRATNSATRYI
jgi:hypothetical protein